MVGLDARQGILPELRIAQMGMKVLPARVRAKANYQESEPRVSKVPQGDLLAPDKPTRMILRAICATDCGSV